MSAGEGASGEIILYEAPDGQVRVDVRLERETVWLSFEQQRKADVAKNATTASDGKTYQTMVLERRPV